MYIYSRRFLFIFQARDRASGDQLDKKACGKQKLIGEVVKGLSRKPGEEGEGWRRQRLFFPAQLPLPARNFSHL